MESLLDGIATLEAEFRYAQEQIGYNSLDEEEQALRQLIAEPDFWQNSQAAQATCQQHAKLDRRLKPWRELDMDIRDLQELIPMDDGTLEADLNLQLDGLIMRFVDLKEELKLSGPYDEYDAILTIHAGAGGTDAQDWTQMLLRMYVRYAEKSQWKVQIVEESAGEEAGLKSVTLEISGEFAYGKLKGEHGVHRLVRLSPFNAESRETSFAKVEVMPKVDKPDVLVIDEKELKIDVYRAGGHGGQSVNTTDSAVRITHLPTGIVVAIQNERSQLQNRETAMTILRSRLIQLQLEQHAERVSELKGPNEQAAWGNQIRSYVLHPYKQVKDLRTRHETSDIEAVLGGDLEPFVDSYLNHTLGKT